MVNQVASQTLIRVLELLEGLRFSPSKFEVTKIDGGFFITCQFLGDELLITWTPPTELETTIETELTKVLWSDPKSEPLQVDQFIVNGKMNPSLLNFLGGEK